MLSIKQCIGNGENAEGYYETKPQILLEMFHLQIACANTQVVCVLFYLIS